MSIETVALEARIKSLEAQVAKLLAQEAERTDLFAAPIAAKPRQVADPLGYLRMEGLTVYSNGTDTDTVAALVERHGLPAARAMVRAILQKTGKSTVFVSELCSAFVNKPVVKAPEPERQVSVAHTAAWMASAMKDRRISAADLRGVAGKRLALFLRFPSATTATDLIANHPQFKAYVVWSNL